MAFRRKHLHPIHSTEALMYDTRFVFQVVSWIIMEVNAIQTRIKDMQGRSQALRGYL